MTRAVTAEGVGTGLLLYVIVGSGIAAERLGNDPAVQLMAHSIAVGLGLAVLVALFQPVSNRSHLNPAVTLAFWRNGVVTGRIAIFYVSVQVTGAVVGVAAANLSFGVGMLQMSTTDRGGAGLVLAEFVSTFVLVLLILALVGSGRAAAVPVAVGAWVAAIVFSTASTGFANPAVTISRILTDTYTGIGAGAVPGFVIAQLAAGALGVPVARYLFSEPARQPSLN
jgi:glycerol uptake facilitator-like aquaporin